VRSNVGDRYVHQALIEGGGVLGGEASGHLLCLDRATTGDGIVSALQVLVALRNSGQTLRQALKGLVRVPQKTVNVRLGNVSAKATVQADSVQAALAVAQQSVAGRGRAFLRPSGTEPVVRVTVEADDAALMQDTLDRLSAAVREALPEAAAPSANGKRPAKPGRFSFKRQGNDAYGPGTIFFWRALKPLNSGAIRGCSSARCACAASWPGGCGSRSGRCVRVAAHHVAAERVGGVQVAEALLAGHLDVILVEIAVGPAQRVGHLASFSFRTSRETARVPAQAGTALRAVQVVAAQPAGVGMGVAMHFEVPAAMAARARSSASSRRRCGSARRSPLRSRGGRAWQAALRRPAPHAAAAGLRPSSR
jgi:hypothetical protein